MFGAPEYKGRNNRSWEKISRRSGTCWEPVATAKHESLSQPAGHQSPDVVKVGWTRLTRPCPYVICPALCLLSCQRRMHDSHFVHRYIYRYISTSRASQWAAAAAVLRNPGPALNGAVTTSAKTECISPQKIALPLADIYSCRCGKADATIATWPRGRLSRGCSIKVTGLQSWV